jgi:D-alanine-D-alanine ligase-like ATP-grasp enzyme
MKIAIINSKGFWSMGWTTDNESQLGAIESLQRLGITVKSLEVSNLGELKSTLKTLHSENWVVWPNAYEVAIEEGSSRTAWIADIIEEYGLPMIGNSADALKTVMLKDRCQQTLDKAGVAIPYFLPVEQADVSTLHAVLLLPSSMATS